jgi:hypothetical protein
MDQFGRKGGGLIRDDPVAALVARLEQGGFDPRTTGPDSWESRCPAHGGRRHNLSVNKGDDGKALIHCHHEPACEPAQIMAAIGMTMADLYPSGPACGRPSGDDKANAKPKPRRRAYPTPEAALNRMIRERGEPTAFWTYRAFDGSEAFRVYRFDSKNPKSGEPEKAYRPVYETPEGWVIGDPPGPLPLYHMPESAGAEQIFVCEGEKASDLARRLGVVATTSAHGAQSPHKTDWTLLTGKSVVILPDHDVPGERYAKAVAKILARQSPRPRVKIIPLTDLWRTTMTIPDGGDIAEWLAESVPPQWTDAERCTELQRLADEAPEVEMNNELETRDGEVTGQSAPRQVGANGEAHHVKRRGRKEAFQRPLSEQGPDELPDDESTEAGSEVEDGNAAKPQTSGGKSRSQSQVQVLLNLARDVTLFRSADMRTYAKVLVPKQEETTVADHHEVLGVNSKAFKSWLRVAYYRETRSAPPSEALTSSIQTLEARAHYEGGEKPVHLRIGSAGDSQYLDLCDAAWRVIEISAGGWTVRDESPIAFRRTPGMLALPTPVQGRALSRLRPYVNVASDDDFKLVIVWLLASLRPTGPYPLLMIQGEQGSAKSTTSRALRLLIDPHSTPLRSEPRSQHDLMIATNATWLIALDNLSGVWPWLSDALCRLATGGGFATRALYSDEDETHFNAMRPILLNGIDDVADRPDLLDRAILLRLPAIPEHQRQEESKFWSKFEADRPQILGALLDAFAEALNVLPDIDLERLPRMADFARFGEAVGQSQGWGTGEFLKAYRKNIEGVTESAAEASPVATAILKLMTELKEDEWQGTPGELLAALTGQINEREAKAKVWPQTPRKLSSELIRLAPVLRRLGISYTRPERTNKGRKVILSKALPRSVDDEPSQQSPLARGFKNKGLSSDGSRDDAPTTPATVTGSPMGSQTKNSLNHEGLRPSSDGRDAVARDLSTDEDEADAFDFDELQTAPDDEVEYF